LRCNLLLEQKGTKTTVEGGEALLLEDATEARDKAGSEGGLGDQADTGGLKRAEGEISEELGAGGGGKVDGGEESASALILDDLLEAADEAAVVGLGVELDAGLDAVMRVSVKCAPDELNHRMCALDIGAKDLHIDGGKTTVGERAADGTGEGEARVESDTRELLGLSGLDVLLDGVELGAAGGGGRGLSGHCERCGRSGDGYGWW
jgi:hypothetical protein